LIEYLLFSIYQLDLQVSAAIGVQQRALSFVDGTVAFGSALEGWAITIDTVSEL
jgi:hypothetical protein